MPAPGLLHQKTGTHKTGTEHDHPLADSRGDALSAGARLGGDVGPGAQRVPAGGAPAEVVPPAERRQPGADARIPPEGAGAEAPGVRRPR